jgi:thioester reductase-like protein
MKILLTGASGGVGTEVVYNLLQKGHAVIALMHRKKELIRYNGKKIKLLDKDLDEIKDSEVLGIKGDVSKSKLGLCDDEYKKLHDSVDMIIHCAARIQFGRELDYYKPVNIEGTKNVLQFAGGDTRKIPMVHVSTAYVSGEINGIYMENDFDLGQKLGNSYEESKFIGEKTVREAQKAGEKIVIARPTIIVGASHNGATSSYTTIYPYLRVLTAGKVQSIPAEYNALLNLIPVDYVSASLVQLAEKFNEVCGKTFNIANDKSITMRDLSNILAEYPSLFVPRYIAPHIFNVENLPVDEQRYYNLVIRPYATYMKRHLEFSNIELKKAIDMPKNINGATLLRRALNFCVKIGYMGRPSDLSIGDFKEMVNEADFQKISN